MDLLLVASLLGAALTSTVVVALSDPLKQALALGSMGLTLAVVFVLLSAPVVALSQVAVSAWLLPTMVLLVLAKTRGERE